MLFQIRKSRPPKLNQTTIDEHVSKHIKVNKNFVVKINIDSPKLNIAIPSPASERIEIDCAIILGIDTCQLQNYTQNNKETKTKELS